MLKQFGEGSNALARECNVDLRKRFVRLGGVLAQSRRDAGAHLMHQQGAQLGIGEWADRSIFPVQQ